MGFMASQMRIFQSAMTLPGVPVVLCKFPVVLCDVRRRQMARRTGLAGSEKDRTAGLADAAEELDGLLAGGMAENHGFTAADDEGEFAAGAALVRVGEAAAEFRGIAEDGAQFAFDLAAVEALGEVAGLKASSGSTGPLRDSSTAERRRLRRVCSSISSAVTRRWFFGPMGGG